MNNFEIIVCILLGICASANLIFFPIYIGKINAINAKLKEIIDLLERQKNILRRMS